jgi:hypothetical protein
MTTPERRRRVSTIRYAGLIGAEEVRTGDRRMIARNALNHRPLPLPVMFTRTNAGHESATAVGRMDTFSYIPGRGWWSTGSFFDPTIVPEVTEAIYKAQQGVSAPSLDLEPAVTVELQPDPVEPDRFVRRVLQGRVMGFTFVPFAAFGELRLSVGSEEELAVLAAAGIELELDPEGKLITTYEAPEPMDDLYESSYAVNEDGAGEWSVNSSGWSGMAMASTGATWSESTARAALARAANLDGDSPSWSTYRRGFLWYDSSDPEKTASYKFPIAYPVNGRMTIYPRAVNNAKARLSSGNIPGSDKSRMESILNGLQRRFGGGDDESDSSNSIQAAGMVAPPREWFNDPGFTRLTPLTVTDEGRVFGHLAGWGTCHTGIGNRCVTVPRSITGYAHFKVGEVVCADGSRLPVGKITLGTGHADAQLGFIPAADHYDNTGACVAIVDIAEDRFGPWVAGGLVAGVTDEQIAALRRSPLSGDWRRIGGNLELVAALAVNSPGFPVLRASGEDEDALEFESLVAAGVVTEPGPETPVEPVTVSTEQERQDRWMRLADQLRNDRVKTLLSGKE